MKTLKDYYRAERKKKIVCWIKWCKYHKQWHPIAAFNFVSDVRHREQECKLVDKVGLLLRRKW